LESGLPTPALKVNVGKVNVDLYSPLSWTHL